MPYSEQRVTSIHKWSEKTFSFTTTKPTGFHFSNGEFVTIGLRKEGKLIARAYSIVSTNNANHLEFLSIYVPDGPLTSELVNIREGDSVWVNSKSTGSLTLKHLRPGRNLYLLATGTGVSPFLSLIRDTATYTAYEKVILVHTVRTVRELVYQREIEALASNNNQLRYVPTVTREPFVTPQRGADLFRSGKLFSQLNLPAADPAQDRVMLCGNPHMNKDMTQYLEQHGWTMSDYRGTGNFTVEKAFVLQKD